ncbi:hypothetical protein SAMN05443287_10671 [Micromonospora phaseoli]|uniref:Heavy-metal-associated domain-containing protein n=1 Tax=Micromonospora phaseoli TaxID=1144548 RepID=A0A1H7ADU8_9ACTN|nr:hypothetical protein [Micromonospora phaseoli]PZV96437.1 hypothetical protein CLV64_107317 [Micromonospora phaseoli]GIJ76125.1 hypothetical protein Xph01_05570 [Micromonospora phaseoli]SEJ63791.1 hypothetical protein SAMN05443287_10671 [Micromonospora phaseoli]
MNTAMKLSGFVLGLAAVFGAAYGAGQVTGPAGPVVAGHDGGAAGHDEGDPAAAGHDAGDSGHGDGATGHLPGGLLVADRGYTLMPVEAPKSEFAFRITGPDGSPVTGYDVSHDERMHLIVARRDLSGFRHVHPEMAADGTWRIASPLASPGVWRAFADFTPTGGAPMTLGVDVTVPGELTERPLPAPANRTTVDGYTVSLAGAPQPGRSATLSLTVSRDGTPVTNLEPYLGAYGHLVALRHGDLAYLHVHPEGSPGDGWTAPGPEVSFITEFPSAGAYRLYLDFRHGGVVRTAEFTVHVGEPGSVSVPAPGTPEPGPGTPEPEPGTSDDEHGTPGHEHD